MISIVVPVHNEEENLNELYSALTQLMESREYEIIFADDGSKDGSQSIIESLCAKDNRCRAIFNITNFGYIRNIYHALCQAQGDAAILLHADMQNPPELITEFIKQWQNGSKIVLGVQKQNNENKLLTLFKSAYYNFMAAICGHIPYMTDFGLFDKSFINILRQIPDPYPYLRGIICDYGFGIKKVYYSKNKRKKGVGMALYTLYDFAMLGITSCTKVIVRAAVWLGLVSAAAGLFRLLVFGVGIYPFVLMLFGVLLFFIGFVGEYVVQINRRLQNHPRVIEDRRINYGN